MNDKTLKKLVVYFSQEGNTRFIAEEISSATGADLGSRIEFLIKGSIYY